MLSITGYFNNVIEIDDFNNPSSGVWVNPQNAENAPDGLYANGPFNSSLGNHFLKCTGWSGGQIPSNSLITKISAQAYGYQSNEEAALNFYILSPGSAYSTNYVVLPLQSNIGWTTEEFFPYYVYVLNINYINNSFTIWLYNGNYSGPGYVDSIKATVYYEDTASQWIPRKRRSYISQRNNETQIVGQQTRFKG